MPSGAYYHADLPNCLVKTSPSAGVGSAAWCPDCPSGNIHYHVEEWNRLFPSYAVPAPSFCKLPSPNNPPSGAFLPNGNATLPVPKMASDPTQPPAGEGNPEGGPITGPAPEPPQEGCGPAMSYVAEKGGGHGTGQGNGINDQLSQPLVAGITPLATYDASGTPQFTQSVEREVTGVYNSDSLRKFHEGTGDGIICFHPPELQDYHLHGASVNPDSLWPTNISETTLLLHNSERVDGSTGDNTVTKLAFGGAMGDSTSPRKGVYFSYDPSTQELSLMGTNTSGDDDSGAASWKVNGDAHITGKLTVDGLIDPTGLEFDPVAANPGGTAANTLWLDSGDSNRLKHGSQLVGIIDGSPGSNRILYWNSSTKRLQDAGFAYTTLYRTGGTDVSIADGGTGASGNTAALANLGILRAIVESDFTTNSSTLSDVTGMGVSVEESALYQFEADILTTGADAEEPATEGIVFDFDGGTATITSTSYGYTRITNTTGEFVMEVTSLGTAISDSSAGVKRRWRLQGYIHVNRSGTIQMRAAVASGGGGGDATVHKGSWMRLTKVR